jgi:hypothetical protein
MSLRIAVSDSVSNSGIQGAKVTINAPSPISLFTDINGYADFQGDYPGFNTFSVAALGHDPYNSVFGAAGRNTTMVSVYLTPASSPPAPQPGESPLERVGTSCTTVMKDYFGQHFYYVRHDRTGLINVGFDTAPKAKAAASGNPACFEIPPAPEKSNTEISGEVGALGSVVNGLIGSFNDIKNSLTGLTDKIQAEAQARIKGLQDLESKVQGLIDNGIKAATAPLYAAIDALKKYIQDSILEIIWTALTLDRKEG